MVKSYAPATADQALTNGTSPPPDSVLKTKFYWGMVCLLWTIQILRWIRIEYLYLKFVSCFEMERPSELAKDGKCE
jgi:hypothetical protein